MNKLQNDYSVLEKLGLDLPPIGVKYSFYKPEDIQPLEQETSLSLCEMLKTAQSDNRSFYITKEHNETCVGKVLLGMEDMEPFAASGQIGPRLGVFDDARCNHRLYKSVPKLDKDTVNYVLFSPAEQMTFEPDVLVISANPQQAEIVMRAMTYSTGQMYKSSCTPVIGCSWLFIYPYVTSEVNFILPALVHGLHGRELYPSDTLLIGIPYKWIPVILTNLARMSLHLEGHKGKESYLAEFEGIMAELSEKTDRT